MKSSRKTDGFVWSRRDVLFRGGQALSLLALPELLIRKAWGSTTTTTFDYYISTTGSDSNAGTLASPWAITSLQDTNANNAKMAGKRIGLIAGTYDVTTLKSGSSPSQYEWPVLNVPMGTASNPTYLGASTTAGVYQGPTGGAGSCVAKILYNTGGGSAGFVNYLLGQDPGSGTTGYFTVDGIEFNGQGYSGGLVGFDGNGTCTGTAITYQNCEIHGINGQVTGDNYALIGLYGTANCLIYNNYVHDAVSSDGQPDHTHGYLEYASGNNVITQNSFINCSGAVESKEVDYGTTYSYNYFYGNVYICVEGVDGNPGNPNAPGTPYYIHHNVFDMNSCGAHAPDTNGLCEQGIYWYNNTHYMTAAGIAALNLTANPGLLTSYNNIIQLTDNTGPPGGAGAGLYYEQTGQALSNYNCFYANSYTGFWGLVVSGSRVNYNTLAAFQAASTTGGGDANSFVANPTFGSTIVPGNGAAQYQLASNSPCIGAGRLGGTSSGAAVNMGAWDGTSNTIGCSFLAGSVSGALVPSPVTSVTAS